MNIPKGNAKLAEIVEFFLSSSAFRRLKLGTQRDYEIHLMAVINTSVEGKDLGAYRCDKLKVRHVTQAYEHWLVTGCPLYTYDAADERNSVSLRGRRIINKKTITTNPTHRQSCTPQ